MSWHPFPRKPQQAAYHSPADELYYGGGAGGGKTDLLIGLALTQHQRSIIFRREYPQLKAIVDRMRQLVPHTLGSYNGQEHVWSIEDGRYIRLGAVQHLWDVERFQGHPHDFIGFDELPQLARSQYEFLVGWNRTTDPTQRCRVVGAGNPPLNPEGYWVLECWAPWLDHKFPDPADPGELRWYAMIDGRLEWFKTGEPIQHKGERITPKSRSFIPARVDDNPALMATDYKARLQNMPEPWRSQLLFGDFGAGHEDDPWQVIPTAWVQAAMARWKPEPEAGLSAVGVDVARGGKCKTVLAKRHRLWWDKLLKYPGEGTPNGPRVVELIHKAVGGLPPLVCVDADGVGAGVLDFCNQRGWNTVGVRSGKRTGQRDASGNLEFLNIRAWAYWHMRDILDPSNPLGLNEAPALPDDRELLADLTAPRYSCPVNLIKIEKKEEIEDRLGRSPDCADAVVYSLLAPPRRPSGPEQQLRA